MASWLHISKPHRDLGGDKSFCSSITCCVSPGASTTPPGMLSKHIQSGKGQGACVFSSSLQTGSVQAFAQQRLWQDTDINVSLCWLKTLFSCCSASSLC